MKRFQALVLTSLACSMILFSCHKDKTAPAPYLGLNYFPTTVGSWIIYDMDSTYFDTGSVAIHIKYQVKEVVDSTFLNNSLDTTQYISRYIRMYDSLVPYDQIPWTIANAYSSNRSSSMALRTEGTATYLKLVFPPKEGKKWNGNAFNALDSWQCIYSKVNVPKTLVFSFDSTLTVSQSGLNDPLINSQIATEIYAAKVGLIYKDYQFLKMQPDTTGSRYTMVINSYSH